MAHRMLCTSCFETSDPLTLVEGSDRLELLAWCVGGLPGWLYCAWRHALRRRICAFCGGGDLVREARATRRRGPRQAPPSGGPSIRSATSPVRWPRALRAPRARLRHGGVALALGGAAGLAWLLSSLGLAAPAALATASQAAAGLGAAWASLLAIRVAHVSAAAPRCQAWDEHGRPIPIQLLH
jgi:hypothetical protein